MSSDTEKRMQGALESLKKEFSGLRTGRASASLLEPVTVEVYGSRMALSQVASVSVPESRLLVVQVWDHGSAPAVEKAIRDAGLGLNPGREGATIRVRVPELNEERRKELIKVAGKYAESARIAIRNIRRDAMDDVKKREKDGHISEDDVAKQNKDIQTTTDKHIKQVDDMLHHKEQDIKTV
ncbi:MAG: ribosome recycling factor [Alphaproteobacteria bacterium]